MSHFRRKKPAQWVTKMCRLYFADIYARKTKGIPTSYPAPGVEDTLREVQQLLPDLEAKMIEFLAEWIQGRPPLRLQKSYQFQVQKTNPKTSLLYLLVLIMTTCPFLLC